MISSEKKRWLLWPVCVVTSWSIALKSVLIGIPRFPLRDKVLSYREYHCHLRYTEIKSFLVWWYHNQLFTMHHSGYYNLVSLLFGTTIPRSFNILVKFFTLVYLSCNIASQGICRISILLTYIVCSSEFTLPQRSITIHVCRQGIIACNDNNMRSPSLHFISWAYAWHVVIVACNFPFSAQMNCNWS